MNPITKDLTLYVKKTFGPFYFYFNDTKSWTVGHVTPDVATDSLALVAHGLPNGTQVRFSTTDVLPAPLIEDIYYYVVNIATDSFKVSLTSGGAAINLLDPGSGKHSVVKRGMPTDLTGHQFDSWVKIDVEDPDAPLILDLAPTIVTPATNGVVLILKDPTQTVLETGENQWSLMDVLPDASRLLFFIGKFTIAKDSTQA
jgi:hypothetical protein